MTPAGVFLPGHLLPVVVTISIDPHAMILIDHFAALDGMYEVHHFINCFVGHFNLQLLSLW